MLTLTKGRNWAFIGLELWFQICFRSNHIAKQHMFYICPSIFAFKFIQFFFFFFFFLAFLVPKYFILRVEIRFKMLQGILL